MRISKATKQYVYDEKGNKYIDCFNGVAHVGHCHPQVSRYLGTYFNRLCHIPLRFLERSLKESDVIKKIQSCSKIDI